MVIQIKGHVGVAGRESSCDFNSRRRKEHSAPWVTTVVSRPVLEETKQAPQSCLSFTAAHHADVGGSVHDPNLSAKYGRPCSSAIIFAAKLHGFQFQPSLANGRKCGFDVALPSQQVGDDA